MITIPVLKVKKLNQYFFWTEIGLVKNLESHITVIAEGKCVVEAGSGNFKWYKLPNPTAGELIIRNGGVIVCEGKDFIFFVEIQPVFDGEIAVWEIEPKPKKVVEYENYVEEDKGTRFGKGLILVYDEKPEDIEIDFGKLNKLMRARAIFEFLDNGEVQYKAYLYC